MLCRIAVMLLPFQPCAQSDLALKPTACPEFMGLGGQCHLTVIDIPLYCVKVEGQIGVANALKTLCPNFPHGWILSH